VTSSPFCRKYTTRLADGASVVDPPQYRQARLPTGHWRGSGKFSVK